MRAFSLIIFLLLAGMASPIFAQHDHRNCNTMEADAELRAKYPELGTLDDFERWLAPLVAEYKASAQQRAVSTIPVVFHVIHDNDPVGSGDNISATLVNAQLAQLNNDFRKILGTSGDNGSPVGADSELEFCMATVNPSGGTMAEPGINRINRNTVGWTAPPYGTCVNGNFGRTYIDNTIKPQSQWDPDTYLNIWVMDMVCGILGYAQFPSSSGLSGLNSSGGAASTDGVVILTTSVGSTTVPNPSGGVFNAGRTLTHELGHFFGLRHIWGDSFCGNDFCSDTPTQQGPSSGCPNTTTCDGVNDMVENYMDYSRDNCMNIFTVDQKARMQTVMANSPRRGALASSTACGGAPPAGCTTTISSFPYSEGFENTLGAWSQGTGDNFNWALNSGITQSTNTGPSGAAAGTFYVYAEASSPNYPSRTTILNSPCFDLASETAATLEFQYHMFGANMGTLDLQARTSGGSWASVWSRTGDQGNQWSTATVNLNSYTGNTLELRFIATTGSNWLSDMAIDDLSLTTAGTPPVGCQDTDVTITINTDNYPAETTWELRTSGGALITSGGPYSATGSTESVTVCLADGCYDFTINDSYGDGICCGFGNGSYEVSDDSGNVLASGGNFGSTETTSFCLPFGGGGACPAIDFSTVTLSPYGGQDNGSVTVQDAGATIFLQNNAWKFMNFSYTVTANTVIEFDFRSTLQGEIHGIGFDNDNSISSNLTFRVYGTQSWGISDFANYSGSGAWTTYTIPVGNYYTGVFDRLAFVDDHDAAPRNANAYFRNVRIYEAGSCGSRSETIVRQTWTDEHDMKVFPNPTRGLLNVNFDQKEAGDVTISVIDIVGREVYRDRVNAMEGRNDYRIDTGRMDAGSYVLRLSSVAGQQTKQFVVLR
ncbi:MAG: M43 family zinc metalloprotease [Bacteroidota bacterium]